MTQDLEIRSRDGLALEAALDAPEAPRAGLVLCHPHPQMGGTMNAPLLLAVRDEMIGRGWAVLRFNFRGIGASEGVSGIGVDEVADAGGASDHIAASFEGVPRAVAGWSFGAAVAVRLAATDPALAGCVAIAPPVDEKPGVTAGLPPPGRLGIEVPLLVLYAANDKQVSPEACSTWGEAAGADVVRVAGANHFFWAKYEQLSKIVGDWLDERLNEGSPRRSSKGNEGSAP